MKKKSSGVEVMEQAGENVMNEMKRGPLGH
jgi:hypothetical protein